MNEAKNFDCVIWNRGLHVRCFDKYLLEWVVCRYGLLFRLRVDMGYKGMTKFEQDILKAIDPLPEGEANTDPLVAHDIARIVQAKAAAEVAKRYMERAFIAGQHSMSLSKDKTFEDYMWEVNDGMHDSEIRFEANSLLLPSFTGPATCEYCMSTEDKGHEAWCPEIKENGIV